MLTHKSGIKLLDYANLIQCILWFEHGIQSVFAKELKSLGAACLERKNELRITRPANATFCLMPLFGLIPWHMSMTRPRTRSCLGTASEVWLIMLSCTVLLSRRCMVKGHCDES